MPTRSPVLTTSCCSLPLFLTWLLINAGDAVWIYYFARAMGNPAPRTVVNKTNRDWNAYVTLMFMVGGCLGAVNCFFWKMYYNSASEWYTRQRMLRNWNGRAWTASNRTYRSFVLDLYSSQRFAWWWYLVHLLIILPIAALMCLGPFFSPFVASSIAIRQAWNHRCDSFPVEVIMDGPRHGSPKSTVPLASFYFWQNGTRTQFYEYTISQDANTPDLWRFNLRNVYPDANVPAAVYPIVSSVLYQLGNNTMSAQCVTGPDPPTNATTECMRGTFDPGRRLTFSITDTRATVNATTNLRVVDNDWLFGSGAPSFVLREVPPDRPNELGDIVVQTAVTKWKQCSSLKVCLGRETGLEMIAPLGLVLLKQDDHANSCTT